MKNDSPITTKGGRYFLTDRIREMVNFWTTAQSEGLQPPPVQKPVALGAFAIAFATTVRFV